MLNLKMSVRKFLKCGFKQPTPLQQKSILKEALEKQINHHENIVVNEINGPAFLTVKIYNYNSLRSYRFEIPVKETGMIRVYQLERTHNVIEDIDDFYKGEMQELPFMTVWERCIGGEFTDKWILESVNRSHNVDSAYAAKQKHLGDLPGQDTVYYSVIEKIKYLPIDQTSDKQKIIIQFHDLEGELEVEVPKRNIGLYQPDRLFVINYKGQHGIFKLSKARKFLRFSKEDWRSIKN